MATDPAFPEKWLWAQSLEGNWHGITNVEDNPGTTLWTALCGAVCLGNTGTHASIRDDRPGPLCVVCCTVLLPRSPADAVPPLPRATQARLSARATRSTS